MSDLYMSDLFVCQIIVHIYLQLVQNYHNKYGFLTEMIASVGFHSGFDTVKLLADS
jgi:hypothetical protein